jgi:hypothetical protein
MAIKAVRTITENLNDGRRVRVNWIPGLLSKALTVKDFIHIVYVIYT